MSITFPEPDLHNVNWLREKPIAHRGLHDASRGIYENTLSACRAALEAGYNIEVDLQPSSDGIPMVFHDYTLERMTGKRGDARDLTAAELQEAQIMDSGDTIPTLRQLLDLIQGKVGIILELKGKPGNDDGFVAAVAHELEDYVGNAAIMSFHHHVLEDARSIAPHLALGLTAEGNDRFYDAHREMAVAANVDFVSYELANLECEFVREFRETGRPLICWTVKSPEDAAYSSKHSDQPTFEGFLP